MPAFPHCGMPGTRVGVDTQICSSGLFPRPRAPKALYPQEKTCPVEVTASVWACPHATLCGRPLAPSRVTVVGVATSVPS